MTETLTVLGLLAAALVAVHLWLRGKDLSAWDRLDAGHLQRFPGVDSAAPEQQQVRDMLSGVKTVFELPMRERIPALRRLMDQMFADRSFDVRIVPVDVDSVRGEWVIAPGADPRRRMLYIHGGAFTMGSPLSHRPLTARFSALIGGAVFAVDYRLMPEHSRRAGIDDCRHAYRWLLDHGPGGPDAASSILVAGDSAGGNLTLSVIAWARDAGLRQAEAAIALSPLTDACFGSPSLRANMDTDPMLAPMAPWARWMPRVLFPWMGALLSRARPSDPAISPLHGDLSGLPPTLVQASECEMLRDDGRRYVAKAVAAGSPARMQTWNNMVHVWQMFDLSLREANQAFDEIGRFLAQTASGPAVAADLARKTPTGGSA